MIDRYALPEMQAVWSQANRYQTWLRVELAVCEVQAEKGIIPNSAWETIRTRAAFDPVRIDEIEAVVQHDILAFLTNIAERVGPDSRFIHAGLTSSDVLDTALALQMKEAGTLIQQALENLRSVLGRRALEFKDTVCIGRTHGIHAEPTTFGLKLAIWYDEAGRNLRRLRQAIDTIAVGKVSGAVGTFAHLDPDIEEATCRKLGLNPAPASTQIVQRDRHAEFLAVLAILAASLEKIAVEIRHLQKTEVREVEEHFAKGQKGSSSMPHKRNPIVCERIAGLARVVRANAVAGFENVALWHERDISHSSVERIILPDSTLLVYYLLKKTATLVERMRVYPDAMQRNLETTRGLIFSQPVLIALAMKGMTREDAYRLVQEVSVDCWQNRADFRDAVRQNEAIRKVLPEQEINACFDLRVQLRNVSRIFRRVGLLP